MCWHRARRRPPVRRATPAHFVTRGPSSPRSRRSRWSSWNPAVPTASEVRGPTRQDWGGARGAMRHGPGLSRAQVGPGSPFWATCVQLGPGQPVFGPDASSWDQVARSRRTNSRDTPIFGLPPATSGLPAQRYRTARARPRSATRPDGQRRTTFRRSTRRSARRSMRRGVVVRDEQREAATVWHALVGPDSTDIARVGAGGLQRGGDVDQRHSTPEASANAGCEPARRPVAARTPR